MARLLSLVLCLLPVAAAGCATDADCSLLGACTGGACLCDPGWGGADCAVLSLEPPVPVTQPGSAYIAPDGYSSWGMSVVHDTKGDKLYHGFVSEFEHGCDLDSWGTNSFVNHVVAQKPGGPWSQAKSGRALGVWAHNPKLVFDKKEQTWVMYHIGGGNNPTKAVNCSKPGQSVGRGPPAAAASSSRPFEIHFAKSLDGPWTPLAAESSAESSGAALAAKAGSSASSLFTTYPGVDNVDGRQRPAGGVWLYEAQAHGSGKAFVSFANFTANPARGGALAWDACGGPPLAFDNGHLIETSKGSHIGSLRVTASNSSGSSGGGGDTVGVLAGVGCAVSYPSAAGGLHTIGPFHPSAKPTASMPADTNYLEVTGSGSNASSHAAVKRVGITQDPEGCRGACEVEATCTSYTWRENAPAGKQRPSGDWANVGRGEGDCYLRSDSLWFPNSTAGPDADLATASVVSGRPWSFDGDNPTAAIDPATGEVRVLYRTGAHVSSGFRSHTLELLFAFLAFSSQNILAENIVRACTDIEGGSLYQADGTPNTYHTASLIGMARAPSWRGPYTMSINGFGGSISNQQYPFDENEDPFLFKTKRGWHALFHANTWTDSRGNQISVAAGAGRLAFSTDGQKWTYAATPPFNGTITWSNGTTLALSRMERPVLVFDEATGKPTHLINGVQPYSHPYTFTLIQTVGE